MNRYRGLALLPVAGAVAVGTIQLGLGGGPWLWFATRIVAEALAAAACIAAAAALRRGDFLFRAWVLSAVSFALPILNRVFRGPEDLWFSPSVPAHLLDVIGVVCVNVASVGSAVLFVRAVSAAGLAPREGVRVDGAAAAAVAVALLLGGPTLFRDVSDALAAGGASDAVQSAVSVAGDTACFILVAPLFRIARQFRGGILAWPWAYLAASNLCWLLFDVTATAARVGGWHGGARAAREAILAVACLFALAAALAHRWTVLGAARPPAEARPHVSAS
jgi:hypothetical protein